MSDSTYDATAARRPRPLPRPVRKAGRVARPVWDTAFVDPVRESHIQLKDLNRPERHLARVGLVALGLLLVSVLFTDVWRGGTLLPLDAGSRLTFLPVGLLPVTLIAFLIAWSLIVWGALVASPAIRIVVAAIFLLTNSWLSLPTAIEIEDRMALVLGPDLIRAGYFVPAAALVLSALLTRLRRTSAVLLPVLRALTVAGLATFFLTHLWVHVVSVEEGFQGAAQRLMSGSIAETDSLLMPLMLVAGVLVIDFSLDVAVGVSLAAREAPLRLARWLLVGLLAVKLWLGVGREWSDWTTYLSERPDAVARTVVSVTLLALVVRLVTRFPITDAFDVAKERLLYGSGAAYAVTLLVSIVVVGSSVFAFAHLGFDDIPGFVDDYPVDTVPKYGNPTLAALALLVGLWLLRRRRRPMDLELGSGLVVLGAWTFPALLLDSAEIRLGFSEPLVDVLVTLGVMAVLARRWRTIDATGVVVLVTITVFSWLVMSRGDWISVSGALLGLPAILVVVVGIVFSLAGDSGFTRTSSRRLPQGARVLLFVGYLMLSVTILHWIEATHADSFATASADTGFYYLGIPWAAWLIGRRLLNPDPAAEEQVAS